MKRILLVDDSIDSLVILNFFLKDHGISCRLASSGKSAVQALKDESFDLIISDYQMEDGDGLWLLSELKKINDAPPCIIVTSNKNVDLQLFISQGAKCVLYKPLDWEELKVHLQLK